jgi:hypothetical protein
MLSTRYHEFASYAGFAAGQTVTYDGDDPRFAAGGIVEFVVPAHIGVPNDTAMIRTPSGQRGRLLLVNLTVVNSNAPHPDATIDAVVTADDVASDQAHYAREAMAEMTDDEPNDDPTFDAVMWGWLRPAHVAIATRERRTGDIPSDTV